MILAISPDGEAIIVVLALILAKRVSFCTSAYSTTASANAWWVLCVYDSVTLVTLAGKNATIKCPGLRVNELNETDFRWQFQGIGKTQEQNIFVPNRPVPLTDCQRCTISMSVVDPNTKIINTELSISDVDRSHAGQFQCSGSSNIQETARKIDLLVLGKSYANRAKFSQRKQAWRWQTSKK